MSAHEHYRTVCAQCGTVMDQCRCMGPKIEKKGLCDNCKPPGVPKSTEVYQRVLDDVMASFPESRAERLLQAVKTKPSFPNPVDEYKPTDENLWKIVLEVASGKRLEFRRGDRTIHAPNGTRGYRNMPNNPQGIAWAVKQYNGFGANWKGKEEKKEAMWSGLARMAAGGVEITEGVPLEAAEALSEGLVRLASQVGGRCYWDLTEEGYHVVMASLTEDLAKKVESLLQDYKEDDAKQLGLWIENNFRINSPKTPSGGKAVKEKLQRMVWTLKNRMSQGTGAEGAAAEVKSDWDDIKSKVDLLTKFTDEGGTVVPKEMTSGSTTYLNEAGLSEEQLKKYTKRLDTVFKGLKGWRKKALAGGLKVALKPPSAFNGTVTGKYHRASDTLWVRTTPAVLKRGSGYASFEYIIGHELGHRYEAKNKLPLDFDKTEWQTSRYSHQEGEAFAELFALTNFDITGQGKPEVLQRFEDVMTGKEKVAALEADHKADLSRVPEQWAD